MVVIRNDTGPRGGDQSAIDNPKYWFVGWVNRTSGDDIGEDEIEIYECAPTTWTNYTSIDKVKWYHWYRRPPKEDRPQNMFYPTKRSPRVTGNILNNYV